MSLVTRITYHELILQCCNADGMAGGVLANTRVVSRPSDDITALATSIGLNHVLAHQPHWLCTEKGVIRVNVLSTNFHSVKIVLLIV